MISADQWIIFGMLISSLVPYLTVKILYGILALTMPLIVLVAVFIPDLTKATIKVSE